MTRAEHVGRAEPVRSCVGCRRRAPIGALVRITGAAGLDVGGPSNGRGAWLCRGGEPGAVDPDCLRAALARRGFERAWRRVIGDDERAALTRLATPAADRGQRPEER